MQGVVDPTFFGLSAGSWTAIASIATAFAVVIGLWQILAARFQNKKSQTLAACSAYDLNGNIYDALNVLWRAKESGQLSRRPTKFRPYMTLVLNHLDAMAIGIDQGLYIESLAYDHLNAIVQGHVRTYIDSGLLERAGVDRSAYIRLIDMRDRWARARPRFRDGVTWAFWS